MITIEELLPQDFDLVAGWLSRPESNRWLTAEWRNRQVDRTLLAMVARNRRNQLFLVRHGGKPCGLVALADIDPVDRVAMVWYLLGDQSLAGKGITSEAVRQASQHAFAKLNLASVYAWIMEDNVASGKVLAKAGFREAGQLRAATRSGDRQVARIYFDKAADTL